MARKKRDILLIATTAYTALILLWWMVARVAEHNWLTTFLLYIPQHPLLLPPVIMGALAIRAKAKRLVWWNVGSLSFVLLLLMGFCLPFGRISFGGHGTRVRVMTFNVHHCSKGVHAVANAVMH